MKILCFSSVPVRMFVGVMAFFITFVAYMLRANISINMLAMARKDQNDPDYGPRYDWSKDDTSKVLGAFFVGSCITGLPAGFLCEWFGGKLSTTIALIVSLLMTGLTPFMADWSVWAVYANRIIVGLAGGIFFPAMHNIVSKWAPPDEKGKFVAALLGGNLGTVFTFQLSGILTPLLGWRNVFYGEAALVLVVTILWIFLVANTPSTHHFISAKELQYIEHSLGPNLSKKKTVAPYFRILTSPAFFALTILHYGNLWGLYFLLTIAPEFMADSLGFDFAKAGIYSSLPHLARFVAGFVFGWIGDRLRRQNTSPNTTRKSFCVFSHIIPGLLLLSIPYIKEPGVVVAILTFSLGFNGAAVLTNLQNTQDLAPNFAGTLYSIINTVGFTSGALGPIIKNELSKLSQSHDFDPWTVMFIIGGLGYIIPAIIFWFLGTAEVQEWNKVQTHDDDDYQRNCTPHVEVQPTFMPFSIENSINDGKSTKF